MKKQLIRFYFCIGIGMDQLTPYYFQGHLFNPISFEEPLNRKPFNRTMDNVATNSFSKQKMNYGKRANKR